MYLKDGFVQSDMLTQCVSEGRVCSDKTASLALWLRCPPRERRILGSNPACSGICPGSSHTSDLKIDTPVAALPGAWRYRVSAGLVGPVSVYCDWVR